MELTPIKPLCVPCINVLPMEILNEISDYETLCRVVSKINELVKESQTWAKQEEINQQFQAAIDELQCQVGELEKIIKNGDFPNDALLAWANKNMPQLIAKIVKYVFFGLSRDGHFVAYIPESWEFIKFDTDMDHNSPTWGHLILRW